jgi:carbamoyltransferase
MNKKNILGLSFFYHDSAAALIQDGVVISAAQEERFTRKKHDESFPQNAIDFCLGYSDLSVADVDAIVFYEKPILKFERLLMTYIKTWPFGFRSFLKAMLSWLPSKLWVERKIRKTLKYEGPIYFTEHHMAHAAGAYFSSPFEDSVVVTMDGVGEWDTTTIGYGTGRELTLTHEIPFPHSLGLLYSALTYYLGFKVNSAEYKVMGLAPYGNPDVYFEKMKKLVNWKDDGSFELDMSYFAYEYKLVMTTKKFEDLFGGAPRKPESELTQREKDIAAALQKVTNEIVLSIVKHAGRLHPSKNLCLSGGVALNCVANGLILEKKIFDNIFIQPASGDAGSALGAALFVYNSIYSDGKKIQGMQNVYLGDEFSNNEIKHYLMNEASEKFGQKTIKFSEHSDEKLFDHVARLLEGENAVGWFQGRMEFGPRALGNRSILADPRRKENWQKINLKIKFRESFRPFAPSVLANKAKDYFDLPIESPYMLLVARVLGNDIPAVTHVDKSARIQTVTKEQNERYHKLIEAFYNRTGCPVLINTSFNVRGEPIVRTIEDAFKCFAYTDMDYLVLGNFVISKSDNPQLEKLSEREKYLSEFSLD